MSENINQAVLAIMNEIGYVQKERKQGVSYAIKGEEAILKAIRPVMVKHEVIMVPSAISEVNITSYNNHKGTYFNKVEFARGFQFIHVPSETSIDVWSYGVGTDTGDKAGNSALTTAKKYALLELFLIVTGEDPEEKASPDEKPVKVEAKNWSKEQRDAVANDAPSVDPAQLSKFLDLSDLPENSNPLEVGRFATLYQGHYVQNEKKGEALQYAKDNI